jgi:osmotically-inducible protein OsmY
MVRDKETVKKDVVDQLYWDSRVNAADVEVSVSDGRVTLSGTVPTLQARRAALLDAYAVSGVQTVENDITVRYGEPLPLSEEVEQRVRYVLAWNPDIDSTGIQVSAEAGLVTLEGTVDAFWKKLYAADLAMSVGGVLDVINKLAVVPTDDIVDESIAEDIVNAFSRNSLVDPEAMDVTVRNGFVSLEGTVNSRLARDAALEVAYYTPGVTGVEDRLIVVE